MNQHEGSSSPWSRSMHSYGGDSDDEEEEMDWEEVDVPVASTSIIDNDTTLLSSVSLQDTQGIEITLDTVKKTSGARDKKVGMSHAERLIRLATHKIHTICLISNGWIRNKYLNDRLLHARLMSLTPLALQMSFTQIHKKREPDPRRRGRLFEAAVMRLVQWWSEIFFEAEPRGSGEIQNRTFDEVANETRRITNSEGVDDESGELIRSCKSLQKHVLLRYGSRDLSAQLFTALCRALGVPARLVISIQSVPWKSSVGKQKPLYHSQKKGKQKLAESDDEEQSGRETFQASASTKDLKGKGKAMFPGTGQTVSGKISTVESKSKATPVVQLRKQRPKGRTLGSAKRSPGPPLGGYPPTQWTEVFSRADGRWLCVDTLRGYVDKRKMFEPPHYDQHNRMVYVLAFEEDGWVRDVTQRYAHEFTNKTSKVRVGGKGKKEWWNKVMSFLTRPYPLHRDDVEDAELQSRQAIEGMPTSVAAFKDHPIYVLERHLLRDETLHPRIEIGKFRGEPVFSRTNVVSGLKTSENWMRSGRVVKEGEQAMKMVKIRAVTIGRKRAIGIVEEDGLGGGLGGGVESEGAMQGLYAKSQTDLYRPPPVVNGKVPKNDFGNIDLYVDTMLPSGAVYIPHKGAAKIARELGFDYAEAVTGFEFKNRRAFPIVTGVVVAAEHESALLEAYWESAQDAEERERAKREERVLKRWSRLVQGLRIRKRLQEQYSNKPLGIHAQHGVDNREDVIEPEAGGFLVETADSVVQAYTLPKPLHIVDPSSSKKMGSDEAEDSMKTDAEGIGGLTANNADMDDDMEETWPEPEPEQKTAKPVGTPKTMQQLAEARVHELSTATPEQKTEVSEAQSRFRSISRKTNGSIPTPSNNCVRPTRRGRKRARSKSSSEGVESESSSNRVKTKAQHTSTSAISTTTRTLRTRQPKSEEAKQKERELELAYRRAIQE